MLHGSTHPGLAGSELTRLLARLADTPPVDGPPAFAQRLGHWLGWTGAISLSVTLSAGLAPPAAAGTDLRPAGEEADFQRVVSQLSASIADMGRDSASSPTDFGPFRRHCIAQQQAMQEAIGALRQRLRGALARRSPALARLAAIDEVMDHNLAAQERSLLGLVPLRLQAHFERLQRAATATAATASATAPAATEPDAIADTGDARWIEDFRLDMNRLLSAELAHRLLPARALLDTLQSSEST